MTSSIDFRPDRVDLFGYAGDTLQFTIHFLEPDMVAGAEWTAQVRSSRKGEVLHQFVCEPTVDGVTVRLLPEQTQDLVEQPDVRVVRARSVVLWVGDYDVQAKLSPQHVRTVVQGRLTMEADVTRD